MIVDISFDVALDAMVQDFVELSLHTGNPGTTGNNEVTGGGYVRQGIDWGVAAGGSVSMTDPVQFEVPDGTNVTHVGLWDGSGVFRASGQLATPEEFGASGTMTVLSLTVSFNNA